MTADCNNSDITNIAMTDPRLSHTTPSTDRNSSNGTFRCPFSGIAVNESFIRNFRDRNCPSNNRKMSFPVNDIVSDYDDNDSSTIRTDTVRSVDTFSTKSIKSHCQSAAIAKSTMRIKISNKSTKMSKDLIVYIKTDMFLFESVYENTAVKKAQVRKWKPDVVRDVKKKIAEIQCVVLDDSADQNVCQTYSLDDLKKVSTSDLFELTRGRDPIQLVLQCVKKPSACEDDEQQLHVTGIDLTKVSLNFQKGLPHATTQNYNSRSEPSISKLSFGTRRSTRPNHMNLSGLVNASFGNISSISNKTISNVDCNSYPMITTYGKTTSLNDKVTRDLPNYFPYKKTTLSSREPNNKDFSKQDGGDTKSNKKDMYFTSTSGFGQNTVSVDPAPHILHSLQTSSLHISQSVPLLDIKGTGSRVPRRSSASAAVCGSHQEKINEFIGMCRLKKGADHQFDESPYIINETNNSTSKNNKPVKAIDRINRFLQFRDSKNTPFPTEGSSKNQKINKKNAPPVAEINVIKGSSNLASPPLNAPNISLSGNLVKEVFPFHIVINEEFRILQVGSSLSLLVDDSELLGKCISDILIITGPVPSFGKWDWSILDKMKGKTIFLESVHDKSFNQKAKMKGTIIELSHVPQRQILLALFPNVKNLSELERMNLSMTDLPIHSCQRETVLLGEHSKSEVKLTNHLDHLHRELIDSMEKQIEDRTNELASANRKLEKANAQLAIQSAKQLEHFACMSHEIRTPLNCIVGMSSLLLEDSDGPSMDQMHADSIRMINTSGELLSAVVDDVLDYAKLESGSFEVDIGLTNLQDCFDSVLYSISPKMQEKNIRLRTHYSPTVPVYLETDSRRLQQVLFNLLGNAGKFSKRDSVIDLSVSLIKATSTNDNNEDSGKRDIVRFSVRDYGKGIDKKDFETIFQPFSQASKETQNVYGGTGLGLSITSKLVHRLGGRISLDSELGKYADFTVDLPMNGKYVDIQKISDCLKSTTIILIEPREVYDYSFTSFLIREESLPLGPAVIEIFGLNVIRCNTLEELNSKIPGGKDERPRDRFTLLVHESLHELCSPQKLDFIFGYYSYHMMTYGQNFLVEKTKTCHFKSLTGLFPATLLEAITKQISKQNQIQVSDSTSLQFEVFPANNSLLPSNTDKETILQTPSTSNATKSVSKDGIVVPHLSSKEKITPVSVKQNLENKTKSKIDKADMKVLYAEDNIVNQKVLARVLNRYGIDDITIVDNGKKAVDISATTKYDCILLDIQMPIMGGIEACKMIMDRDPDSKIIFVTAHALDEFKVKAKSVGAKGFISKPFRIGDIDDALKDINI